MGIHGINIFGQGIQIFLNTFSLILGCQETVLLHKKASFPFIWRLLYMYILTLQVIGCNRLVLTIFMFSYNIS